MKNSNLIKSIGLGAIFFLSPLQGQETEEMLRSYLSKNESFKGYPFDFRIVNEDHSQSLNVNIVNVQQYYSGTAIYRSLAKAVIKERKVISFHHNFKKSTTVSSKKEIPIEAAFQAALGSLNIADPARYKLLDDKKDFYNPSTHEVLSAKFYFEQGNELIPARQFFILIPERYENWSVLVNLENGEILEKTNQIRKCDIAIEDTQTHTSHSFYDEKLASTSPINYTFNIPTATYNVFKLPVEAPTFGSRSLVSDPWDILASPLGWHSDGTTNYTITRGNNVHAFSPPDFSPDGGSSLSFNFPYQESATTSAYDNKSAAVTNLFYMNNMLHDIFYKFGFTESARNFQMNNFNNGGLGSDAVQALAFNDEGLNGAMFSPGVERTVNGVNQVQAPGMYLSLYVDTNEIINQQRLFYNAPADAVSRPAVASGIAMDFGPQIMDIPVTGDIGIPSDPTGCTTPIAGSLIGKIALVTHAGCDYPVKVKNAEDAGSIGAIVYRTDASLPEHMEDNNNTPISIPSIMIGKTEGEFIAGKIGAGEPVNVSLKDLAINYKNSSFDSGVMAHEYGHGVSERLTGQGYDCLNNIEQMGEGWSDFFGLMLTNTPGYTANTARGIGTYILYQGTAGLGIRNKKYSTAFSVNNYTYADTNISQGPHALGEIWATILWDLHWKFAAKYGYSHDIAANPNSGSAKVFQLVMDGLKLQPCSPDFVSGRNAILQADQLTGGIDQCDIWEVFAKRGVGVNASSGTSADLTDQVEDFSVPSTCNVLATHETKTLVKEYSIYPNPARNEFFINFPAKTLGKVSIEIYDMSGKLVSSENKISPDAKKAVSTDKLISGTYMVKVKGLGFDATSKVIIKK